MVKVKAERRKAKLKPAKVAAEPTVSQPIDTGFTRTEVSSVTTLGPRLIQARSQREASIADAELATKVAGKYLTALEHGRYHELPADVYVTGFVRRYAEWLELDASEAISQYRSERSLAHASAPKLHRATTQNVVRTRQALATRHALITPERFIGLVVSAFVLTFVGYLWFQVKSFAAAPELTVAQTVDNEVVKVDTLTLSGTTDAQATLAVNGEIVPVDPTGKFIATIHLVDGVNTIELRAQNRTDQETIKVLKVLATLDNAKPGTAAGVELPVVPPVVE